VTLLEILLRGAVYKFLKMAKDKKKCSRDGLFLPIIPCFDES